MTDLVYIWRNKAIETMTTLTFEVEVDDETAERVRQNAAERFKVNLLIKNLLETDLRADARERIKESIHQLSEEARKNGLTEEKLAEILEEIDQERG